MASFAKKLGKGLPLPFIMAVLAGAAVALIMFLLPIALIERAVVASGLPAILAAAEPPLGATARALLAVGGGAVAVLVTGGGLILVDRLGRELPRRDRAAPPVETDFAPRRRMLGAADAEAPRRPIFAESEFGATFATVQTPDEDIAHISDGPPEQQIELLDLEPIARAMRAERPAAAEEDWAEEADFEAAVVATPVYSEMVPPVPAGEVPSLSVLLGRLEAGLERKRAVNAAITPEPRPMMAAVPGAAPDMDEALRDALGALQRMTARSR